MHIFWLALPLQSASAAEERRRLLFQGGSAAGALPEETFAQHLQSMGSRDKDEEFALLTLALLDRGMVTKGLSSSQPILCICLFAVACCLCSKLLEPVCLQMKSQKAKERTWKVCTGAVAVSGVLKVACASNSHIMLVLSPAQRKNLVSHLSSVPISRHNEVPVSCLLLCLVK